MGSNPFGSNTLYYGDNLEVLRKYFPNECVDLIYLDPPFNSKADYNILFKEATGEVSAAQIQAFSDFWHWDKIAEQTYLEIQEDPNLTDMIQFLHAHLGRNDMLAYLVMMTMRLKELHRVLKPTGSLYLHCDPTASHYLKIVMDKVFGVRSFRNEIVWRRSFTHGDTKQGAKHFGRCTDSLLFYVKTDSATWNPRYTPYSDIALKRDYKYTEEGTDRVYRLAPVDGPGGASKGNPYYEFLGVKGYWRFSQEKMQKLYEEKKIVRSSTGKSLSQKMYLDEAKGRPVDNLWDDINRISPTSSERLGYPTQKPQALLERLVQASSNEGDLVLDPFCGCGTAIMAAHKLKRRWIGIDITHLAISLIRARLKEIHVSVNKDYKIIGEPADFESARELAQTNPYQFQWWALSLIDARPAGQPNGNQQGKKGADKGIDGWLTFREAENINLQRIAVQVKGGTHIGAQIVRDLIGTVQSTKSAMGILITLYEPTEQMKQAAMEAEYYESKTWGHKYPKIQILTIPELLKSSKPILPHTR
jgi:DNA modification methylase